MRGYQSSQCIPAPGFTLGKSSVLLGMEKVTAEWCSGEVPAVFFNFRVSVQFLFFFNRHVICLLFLEVFSCKRLSNTVFFLNLALA